MCVDAYQRGMPGWWFLIILVPMGEWIYFFLYKVQDFQLTGGGGSQFVAYGPKTKCRSCQHCSALYSDGVQCQIGDRQPIFKDRSHIAYCTMHTPQ
jgi:hypothetical protein